jgi:RNA polymerase sigma factor (TIGR02999 family)
VAAEPAVYQQVTDCLAEWRAGAADAAERLFAVVHPQLQRIAANHLRQERTDQTLEPNALVNELYLRLVGTAPLAYNDRAHFFAVAAQTMRRILIEHARARTADKRGGERERISLSAVDGWSPVTQYEHVLLLDQALTKLAQADPRAARVVAAILGVSTVTVKRDWRSPVPGS